MTAAAISLAGVGSGVAAQGAAVSPAAQRVVAVARVSCPVPPLRSSAPDTFVAVGDTLYFTANDGIHGRELWKSDGTEAGTRMVRNVKPDRFPVKGSRPKELASFHGKVFFSAQDGETRRELWKSDGTRAGTVLVKDIAPRGASDPQELTRVGRQLFFSADDVRHDRELWKSDGSRRGTVLVKDIVPVRGPYDGSEPHDLTAMNGRLFFGAENIDQPLWRSDGSAAGTVPVKTAPDYRSEPDSVTLRYPAFLTAAKGWLLFAAGSDESDVEEDLAPDHDGRELWRTDGAESGTVLVKDINPIVNSYGAQSGFPGGLTAAGDRVFFSAYDGVTGSELWQSDGTEEGTVLVEDINSQASGSSSPVFLTARGEDVFFSADDGVHGRALWISDGSEAGTALVADITPTGGGPSPRRGPSLLTTVGSEVFFRASDGTHGWELWKSDGTPEGTAIIKDIRQCTDRWPARSTMPTALTAVGDRLFFAADDGSHGKELWVSDGTSEGTVMVKDINRPVP